MKLTIEIEVRKRGICAHGSLGPVDGQPLPAVKCNHCGKVFANAEIAHEERREILI